MLARKPPSTMGLPSITKFACAAAACVAGAVTASMWFSPRSTSETLNSEQDFSPFQPQFDHASGVTLTQWFESESVALSSPSHKNKLKNALDTIQDSNEMQTELTFLANAPYFHITECENATAVNYVIGSSYSEGFEAQFVPELRGIIISRQIFENPQQLIVTVRHEIQHAIKHIENELRTGEMGKHEIYENPQIAFQAKNIFELEFNKILKMFTEIMNGNISSKTQIILSRVQEIISQSSYFECYPYTDIEDMLITQGPALDYIKYIVGKLVAIKISYKDQYPLVYVSEVDAYLHGYFSRKIIKLLFPRFYAMLKPSLETLKKVPPKKEEIKTFKVNNLDTITRADYENHLLKIGRLTTMQAFIVFIDEFYKKNYEKCKVLSQYIDSKKLEYYTAQSYEQYLKNLNNH